MWSKINDGVQNSEAVAFLPFFLWTKMPQLKNQWEKWMGRNICVLLPPLRLVMFYVNLIIGRAELLRNFHVSKQEIMASSVSEILVKITWTSVNWMDPRV